MSKLAKWLPFKFNRNKKSDAESEPGRSVPVQVQNTDRGVPAQRLFDTMMSDRFWRDPFALFGEMDRFFGDFSPRAFQPSIDVINEDKHVRVTAELPGLTKDDVEVTVEDGMLTIRGEKKSEQEADEDGCYRLERYFGHFQRVLPLPPDVDPDGTEAKFDNGLLTVRLPKTANASKARKITVG